MAKTARDIITSSLKKLGVVASGETPSAEELQDGLTALQAMLETWSENDLIAVTPEIKAALLAVTSVNSEMSAPAGYLDAIFYNLCIELVDEFGGQLTPSITGLAEKNLSEIKTRNLVGNIPALETDGMFQGDRQRMTWALADTIKGGT